MSTIPALDAGLCGEVSHAEGAVSVFLQSADCFSIRPRGDRFAAWIRGRLIAFLQARSERATARAGLLMGSERKRITCGDFWRWGGQGGGVCCRIGSSRLVNRNGFYAAGDIGAGRGAAHRHDGLLSGSLVPRGGDIEVHPAGGLALMPVPGDVDVVIGV